MTFVPLTTTYNLVNAQLTIGDDEYTEALSGVEFTPSTKTSEWKGFAKTITAVDLASWTAKLSYAQDLAPTGLTRFLHEHEGEVFPCTFVPLDGGPTIEATLQLSAAKIGGAVGSGIVTGDVTLAVQGKPMFVDPIPES